MDKLQTTTIIFLLLLASQPDATACNGFANELELPSGLLRYSLGYQIAYNRQAAPIQPSVTKYGAPEFIPTVEQVQPQQPIMLKYGGPERVNTPEPSPTEIKKPDVPEQPIMIKYGGPEMYSPDNFSDNKPL